MLTRSSIARARARLRACRCGSAIVQAWLTVALHRCWCGSARVLAWLCAPASTALHACRRGPVCMPAKLCARARPMHIANGPRPHVPPADLIVCPLPSTLTFSPSPSSLHPSPPFPPLSGGQKLSHPVPDQPLVRALRRCRPSGNLRCLAYIAPRHRRAWQACGRHRAGQGRRRPCGRWAGP